MNKAVPESARKARPSLFLPLSQVNGPFSDAPRLSGLLRVKTLTGRRTDAVPPTVEHHADQAGLECSRRYAASCGLPFRVVRRVWESYVWPGGYPVFYFVADGGILCSACANKNLRLTLDPACNGWHIVNADVNHEDPLLACDHCGGWIEAAYLDEDEAEAARRMGVEA